MYSLSLSAYNEPNLEKTPTQTVYRPLRGQLHRVCTCTSDKYMYMYMCITYHKFININSISFTLLPVHCTSTVHAYVKQTCNMYM